MSGFFLLDHGKDIAPYCQKLAELWGAGRFQSYTDQGETSPGGQLRGVEDCIRGVEVGNLGAWMDSACKHSDRLQVHVAIETGINS